MDTSNHRKKIENALSSLESLLAELRVLGMELSGSEERFRLVAEFAYDWEYWQDIDGTFLYCSPSCKSITEYTDEEFSQNKELFNQIIHHDDLGEWQHHTHEMTDTGEVKPLEFRIITKSGKVKWIHHVCRMVQSKSGERRGVRGSNRDITAQKLMKEEIKVLKGLLPICASCKKIRDDKGYWTQIEAYIKDHSQAEFSHGICPDCAKILYPGLDLFKNK